MSNLREILKNNTKPIHTWLEENELLVNVTTGEFDIEQYKILINKFSIFFNNIEPIISKYKNEFEKNGLEDIEERLKKSIWLADDRISLDINTPLEVVNFKTLTSYSAIVGALYVIEGSTMGGMQIKPNLQKNLDGIDATNYYSAYGSETMMKFKTFCQFLDNKSIDIYEANLGACETFLALRKLLDD